MKKITKKIINRSRAVFSKPDYKKIIFVNFAVTYLCNSKCKSCNIWKKYLDNPREASTELTLDEIKKTFERSQYLGSLEGIVLTGGEAFLMKDLVDLCGFFINKYPEIGITIPANAVNVELEMDKLREIVRRYNPKPGKIYISVSLDGIGANHDQARNIPGNFQKALKLISLIKNELPVISLGVSFTINPWNYKDLPQVYKLSRELGIDFSFQWAQTSGAYYKNTEKQFSFTEIQLREIEKEIALIEQKEREKSGFLQKLGTVNNYYMANASRFKRDPVGATRSFKCYSGIQSCFLDPFGNVFPCIMLDKKIGNIRENDFDKIWISSTANEVREFIAAKKCVCWTPCETGLSLRRDPKVVYWNLRRLLSSKS